MKRAALLLICWCGCLGGHPPKYDYFVLAPTHALDHAAPAADAPTVGISDVTIPPYLDRESVVTRTDDHQLVYSKKDRWAEPLDRAFESTLRAELASALAPAGIAVPPRTGEPTYEVHVEVLRFERRGDNQVELWARWTLRSDTEIIHTGETRLQVAISGADDGAAAAALSQAITKLAVAIGDEVRHADQVAVRAPKHRDR